MDDGYGTCTECRWSGKLRKDGTMRKHHVAKDSGKPGATGSFPQDMGAPICQGSGEDPKHFATESHEIATTTHGGGREPDEPRYVVQHFDRRRFWAVYDTRTGLDVLVTSHHRQANTKAAELNKGENGG